MNNKQFYNSFSFKKYNFSKMQSTNRLKTNGSKMNHIGILLYGNAKFEYGKETLYASVGDIVFIPKDRPYRSYWIPGEEGFVSWLSFSFEHYPFLDDGTFPLQLFAKTKELEIFIDKMSEQLIVNCTSVGIFYQMLGEVIKILEKDTSSQNLVVQKALDYMRDNNDYLIGDIAKHCHVSESGLYSIFKKVLQKTPVEMKQKTICEQAVELLMTTNLSVEEVSSMLGFSSSSYFRKVLKKHTGKTPRAIRSEIEI